MLGKDLNQAVNAQKPSDEHEVKQFWKVKCVKSPSKQWEELLSTYKKHLVSVGAAKCGTTSKVWGAITFSHGFRKTIFWLMNFKTKKVYLNVFFFY